MILRDYQQKCLDDIRTALLSSRKALCVAVMGAGKTAIFSKIAALSESKNKKVLILVQKNILVEQAYNSIKRFTDNVGIYNAGLGRKEIKDITVASVQSLAKIDGQLDFDTCIYDEAHRYDLDNPKSQGSTVLSKLNNPYVLGFTATPFSSNDFIYGKDKFWDKPVCEIDAQFLTDQGYLVPLLFESPLAEKRIDLSQVKKNKGDFIVSDLSDTIMRNKELIHAQVEDALSRSQDRKYKVWLATSIEHAEYLYSIVPWSYIVHSKRKDRDEQLDRFKESGGNLISVLVVSEGFDFVHADCLIMMRPTRSHVLYRQAAGRVLRIAPDKKDALFLDYGGIVEALGSIYQQVTFDKKKQKNDMKLCEDCGAFNHAKANQCRKCGNDFLVMCSQCFSLKPYSKPCDNCERKKVNRDSFKNLTSKAYYIGYKEIHMIIMSDYKSKADNDCIRIQYYANMSHVHTEYFERKYQTAKFKIRMGQLGCKVYNIDDVRSIKINTPVYIKIKKNDNGYKEIEDARGQIHANIW